MGLNAGSYRYDPSVPGAVLAAPLDASIALSLTGPPTSTSTASLTSGALASVANQGTMAPPVVPNGPVAGQSIGGDPESASVELSNRSASGHLARGGPRMVRHAGREDGVSARAYSEEITASGTASFDQANLTSQVDPGSDELLREAHGADLIADALPIAGESLEHSLDEFVRQLETVDVAGIVTRGPTPASYATFAVTGLAALAIATREVTRRRFRSARQFRVLDPVGRELALSFPELPRGWSSRP